MMKRNLMKILLIVILAMLVCALPAWAEGGGASDLVGRWEFTHAINADGQACSTADCGRMGLYLFENGGSMLHAGGGVRWTPWYAPDSKTVCFEGDSTVLRLDADGMLYYETLTDSGYSCFYFEKQNDLFEKGAPVGRWKVAGSEGSLYGYSTESYMVFEEDGSYYEESEMSDMAVSIFGRNEQLSPEGNWIFRNHQLIYSLGDGTRQLLYSISGNTIYLNESFDIIPAEFLPEAPIDYESDLRYTITSGCYIGNAEMDGKPCSFIYRLEADGSGIYSRQDLLIDPSVVYENSTFRWKPAKGGFIITEGGSDTILETPRGYLAHIENTDGVYLQRAGYGFYVLEESIIEFPGISPRSLMGNWNMDTHAETGKQRQFEIYPDGSALLREVVPNADPLKTEYREYSDIYWRLIENGVALVDNGAGGERLRLIIDGDFLTDRSGNIYRKKTGIDTWNGSNFGAPVLSNFAQSGYVGVWKSSDLDLWDPEYLYFYLAADGSGQYVISQYGYDTARPLRWEPAGSGFRIKTMQPDRIHLLQADHWYNIEAAPGDKSVHWHSPSDGIISLTHIENYWEPEAVPEEPAAADNYALGGTIHFGSYEQDSDDFNGPEPIKWRILAEEDNRVLLISEEIIDARVFEDSQEILGWEDSYIRAWLNGEFLQTAFTPEEQARIVEVSLDTPGFNAREPIVATNDKVFIFSIEEVEQYMPLYSDRMAEATTRTREIEYFNVQLNGCSEWWLRSTASLDRGACTVDQNGNIQKYSILRNWLQGLRPAIWIELPENVSLAVPEHQKAAGETENGVYSIGGSIYFGNYEQDYDNYNGPEPIKWRVLDISGDGSALLISDSVLDMAEYKSSSSTDSGHWSSCNLHDWLNEEFLPAAFSEDEAKRMIAADEYQEPVTMLTEAQIEQFLSDPADRCSEGSDYVYGQYPNTQKHRHWWVRVHNGYESIGNGRYVNGEDGSINSTMIDYRYGVRPVIRILLPDDAVIENNPAPAHTAPKHTAEPETKAETSADSVDLSVFRWEMCADGSVKITGYLGSGGSVSVPRQIEGAAVTEIGEKAFEATAVSEIILPEGISAIGDKAFYKCESLDSIYIPESLKDFGKFAFNNCPNISLNVAAGSEAETYAASKKLDYTVR